MLPKLVENALDQLDEIGKKVDDQITRIQEEAADEIAKIQEKLPFQNKKDETKKDGETNNNDDEFVSPSITARPSIATRQTSSETPTQFLKKLRSGSILTRKQSSGSTSSLDEASVSSSISDSIRLNNKNMPNKITGEMGVEIYPSTDNHEEIIIRYVHDRHFQYIHPNVFAPACLTDVQRMGGGGSGVSVFSGTHPLLGEIVMKHGGFGDMKELFALGTISQQLDRRGQHDKDAGKASKAMKACLPEFKMVYISPQHVLYKQKAVWGKLKKLVKIGRDKSTRESFASLAMKIEMSERVLQIRKSTVSTGSQNHLPLVPQLISLNDSKFLGQGANIRIYECDSGDPVAYIEDCSFTQKPSLNFVFPKNHIRCLDDQSALALECTEDFDSLEYLYDGLSPLMSKHLFKFTLAQKRIGGHKAKTGSQWLFEGKLDGLVLGNLIARFIETVRNLHSLTLPEEVNVVDKIQSELQELKNCNDANADDVSAMADQYMGNAIKKNFHPHKGRIRFLRKTCKGFQDGDFYLEQEEEEPAKHLAALGEPGVLMSDVIDGASSEPALFHPDKDFWLNLMGFATDTSPLRSPNSTKRVWTSGLCDAGIHNLFVSRDDVYFFDLGPPALQSLPAFMTKFLFSFFHTLGMQEDPNSEDGEWVRRFEVQGDKLALTQETKDLLPKAYDAFEVSLTRIIEEVFDGDQSLRWLLLQYVTLQLLSDASFCLQRWSMKGGGVVRDDDNHNEGLERWLWRALWDIYVAFNINTLETWDRFGVELPEVGFIEDELRESLGASIDGMALEELLKMDQLDIENKMAELEAQNAAEQPPFRAETSRLRRSSVRWSSERLNLSTLHELSMAAFEYSCPIDDSEDDDESDTEAEEYTGAPAGIVPPPFHSLDSMMEEDNDERAEEQK